MYKTEAAFSRSLSTRISKSNAQVQKIESHDTGNGIPDLFVQGWGYDCWIELKNDNSLGPYAKEIKVKWRPGQQGWAHVYGICHKDKVSLTVIACAYGLYIIPMTQLFKDDKVLFPQFIPNEDLKHVNIVRIFFIMSHIDINKYTTYREAVIAMVDEWYGTRVDYDPETLWDPNTIDSPYDMRVFLSYKLEMINQLETLRMEYNE